MSEADSGGQPARQSPAGWPAIPESVATVIGAVPADIGPGPAGVLPDGPHDPDLVVKAARLVVAAWVTAVNGDDCALRTVAELTLADTSGDDDDGHDAARDLLNPVGKDWVIAPGPEVTGIGLRRLDLTGDVPAMGVQWRFTASQRYAGAVIPPGWTGPGSREYVGSAHLSYDASRPFPWRLARGHVQEADEYYGYTYTTRDETSGEYQSRSGSPASRAALVPGGTYRLLASCAEDDHKFGRDVRSDVDSDVPLTREEAQRLAEEVIEADARREIAAACPDDGGELEVRPSLRSLQVIRLLEPAPPVEAAAAQTGPALDEFARRYAASRELWFPDDRAPAWRDPGPWFLATTDITRSRGLLRGPLGGGPGGEFWYAEGAVHGLRRAREKWAVARYEIPQARRAGSIACAARDWPGELSSLPRGLVAVAAGDEAFGARYAVGVAGGEAVTSGPSWVERLLSPELTAWLLAQPYGQDGADATSFQVQGGLVCVYSRGWPATADALDAFCDRAATIAAAIEHATRFVIM